MTYLRLFWEFFKTGLFAIGGGMATLPFLKEIGVVHRLVYSHGTDEYAGGVGIHPRPHRHQHGHLCGLHRRQGARRGDCHHRRGDPQRHCRF